MNFNKKIFQTIPTNEVKFKKKVIVECDNYLFRQCGSR